VVQVINMKSETLKPHVYILSRD